jgi:hypothetical protein
MPTIMSGNAVWEGWNGRARASLAGQFGRRIAQGIGSGYKGAMGAGSLAACPVGP